MTAVPCSYCSTRCGPNKLNEPFSPQASSTFEKIGCQNDERCSCGTPRCQCDKKQCSYSRSYVESSSSAGHLISDVMHFGGNAVRVNFGCETQETGEIYRQAADGIMGLGVSEVSIPFQLAKSGAIEPMFSLCFGDVYGEGALLLGDVAIPPEMRMRHVPLVSNPRHPHYYNINLHGMSLGDERLNSPASAWVNGYGVVVDSGTTFTYIPSQAYNSFRSILDSRAKSSGMEPLDGPDPKYKDVCWSGGPVDPRDLRQFFPPLVLHLDGGVDFELEPMNYLFIHMSHRGGYCLGIFDNGQAGTLLGGVSFRNVLVQYDHREGKKQLGLAHAPCRLIGQGFCLSSPEAPAGGGVTQPRPDCNISSWRGRQAASVQPEQGQQRFQPIDVLSHSRVLIGIVLVAAVVFLLASTWRGVLSWASACWPSAGRSILAPARGLGLLPRQPGSNAGGQGDADDVPLVQIGQPPAGVLSASDVRLPELSSNATAEAGAGEEGAEQTPSSAGLAIASFARNQTGIRSRSDSSF
eukprot:CAMPEP_0177598816 /NCGR_PEP_ID=MMETSP0419_2-20121207/12605_1 /TAXON_ID=582737 /ORGANISM="Tetraselmis sp., Strain GSL018" /LENGTH=521 /DNA_ID=CAMNT_0019091395 /DNA_START=616 /DNA_END=2181 /DNA_ORIENTATION=+